MNFNNSSSTISAKQSSSINDPPIPVSFFKSYNVPILIILVVLIFSLIIFISLFISKFKRKKKKKIIRQNVIIRKQCESKADTLEDPHTSLMEPNYSGMIRNIRIISTDPIDTTSDTRRGSTLSVSSQHISITNPSNEKNDNDELLDLDFADISLHHVNLLNNNLTDPSLLEATHRSSHDLFKNPYEVEYRQQEREKAEVRKEYINAQISTSSKTSEESCV